MGAIFLTLIGIFVVFRWMIRKVYGGNNSTEQMSDSRKFNSNGGRIYDDFKNLSPAEKAVLIETLKDDYSFPSESVLNTRIKAGYYDDDPDMLEIHDPDRYDYLYGDDEGDDDYDGDDGEVDW